MTTMNNPKNIINSPNRMQKISKYDLKFNTDKIQKVIVPKRTREKVNTYKFSKLLNIYSKAYISQTYGQMYSNKVNYLHNCIVMDLTDRAFFYKRDKDEFEMLCNYPSFREAQYYKEQDSTYSSYRNFSKKKTIKNQRNIFFKTN